MGSNPTTPTSLLIAALAFFGCASAPLALRTGPDRACIKRCTAADEFEALRRGIASCQDFCACAIAALAEKSLDANQAAVLLGPRPHLVDRIWTRRTTEPPLGEVIDWLLSISGNE